MMCYELCRCMHIHLEVQKVCTAHRSFLLEPSESSSDTILPIWPCFPFGALASGGGGGRMMSLLNLGNASQKITMNSANIAIKLHGM
mmetsp:Transcript_46/g.114  ORF Transcript_46/g.114 Transcript_46/m.114 type:complete len:87 (+) Transcript_46:348-608(+)